MIKQLENHLVNVEGFVSLEERNSYEFNVEQDAAKADADTNIKKMC